MRKALLLLLVGGVAEAHGSWGIGIRSTRASISPDTNVNSHELFRGGGAQLRYRAGKWWSFELALESMSSSVTGLDRTSIPATFSSFFHLLGDSRWDWYVLAGFGSTADQATFATANGGTMSEKATESHFQLGTGVERELGPFGVGLELRAAGLHRTDSGMDGATVIPLHASGHELAITCTYYF